MVASKYTSIYNEGFEAAKNHNLSIVDNPYDSCTEQHLAWYMGFDDSSKLIIQLEEMIDTGVTIINPNTMIAEMLEVEKELLVDEF